MTWSNRSILIDTCSLYRAHHDWMWMSGSRNHWWNHRSILLVNNSNILLSFYSALIVTRTSTEFNLQNTRVRAHFRSHIHEKSNMAASLQPIVSTHSNEILQFNKMELEQWVQKICSTWWLTHFQHDCHSIEFMIWAVLLYWCSFGWSLFCDYFSGLPYGRRGALKLFVIAYASCF